MFIRLMGRGIKSVWLIFKTEMLIYQPEANLDEKSLFYCMVIKTLPMTLIEIYFN